MAESARLAFAAGQGGRDVGSSLSELFAYHFMVNALIAGTLVALLGGVVGWFVVLRRQSFLAHTLTTTGFPGAAGASLVGVPAMWGYYCVCTLAGLLIARASGEGRHGQAHESAVIGAVQALFLALGFMLLRLYGGVLEGLESLLFGTFLGIADGQVIALAMVTAGALGGLCFLARPLFFASVDAPGAEAAGVPTRALSGAFVVLLGVAVAATSQITGALLVFCLLVTPAATAQQITMRPRASVALSAALAVALTWVSLTIAYFSPYPVGFYVTSLSFGLYLLARLGRALVNRWAGAEPATAGA